MTQPDKPVMPEQLTPFEREHLIEWHGQCAKFCEQSDDFGGYQYHKMRAARLSLPPPGGEKDAVPATGCTIAEREMGAVIDERDAAEDMADQLAEQIAAITGAEIGEHTSANNPWRNAMLAADEFIAADIKRLAAAPHAEPGEGQEPEVFGWCESAEVQGEGQRCSHQCVSCFRAEYQPYVDSLRATVARLRGERDEALTTAKLNGLASIGNTQRAEAAEKDAGQGWEAFYRLRKQVGEDKYPTLTNIVRAARQQDKEPK